MKGKSSSSESVLISLVVATLGRTEELSSFLESVADAEESFEIIVVDQNSDDRLKCIIERFSSKMQLSHFRIPEKNASFARNYGAERSVGQWIGFPDDDCLYTPSTLSTLVGILKKNPCKIVMGSTFDFQGKPLGKFSKKQFQLTLFNFVNRVSEPGLFIEGNTFRALGGFNKDFGPGGKYFAAEAYELTVRILKQQVPVYFDADIRILHPRKIPPYDAKALKVGYTYSYGFGSLLAEQFGTWAIWYYTKSLASFLFKMAVLRKGERKFAVQWFYGLNSGLFKNL